MVENLPLASSSLTHLPVHFSLLWEPHLAVPELKPEA